MFLRGSILVAILSFSAQSFSSTLPYDDSGFSCTEDQKIDQYVRDFQININSFGGKESCDSQKDSKKLFNDLALIEGGEFENNGKENVFIRDIIAPNEYYNWLKAMTYGIRRGHDIPWATAYNSGGYFTFQDGWTHLSSLGRVGTIIHEARHTEGYRHYRCVMGPYSNTNVSGCDSSISQEGSHGVEMEYYSRVVLQGSNFHPVYQSMARLMALGRGNFVFNDRLVKSKESIVGLSNDSIILLNENSLREINFKLPNGHLKRTSFGVSILNDNVAFALDLYDHSDDKMIFDDQYSYFKLLKENTGSNIVDMEEFDIGNLRHVFALNDKQEILNFVFVEGEWSRPKKISGAVKLSTVSPSGQKGLFVIKEQGQVCRVDLNRLNCEDINELWPSDLLRVAHYNGKVLGLYDHGQVLDLMTNETYLPLQDKTLYDFVSAPVFPTIFEL